MGDISTGLIEFAEYKRLLFERIRNKLGDMTSMTIDPSGVPPPLSAMCMITDTALSNLYVESAETFELYTQIKGVKIIEDKTKMKWMGLYTTALAKEVHARIKFATDHNNGMNVTNEWCLTEYKSLLAESKEEKDNLIKLLNGIKS